MQITGDERLIYEDQSQKTTCSFYLPEGTDVCSDVIRIPLNRTSVRKLTISTDDYLTLCEVQVFGGITFFFSKHHFLTNISIFNTCVMTCYSPVYMTRQLLYKMLSQIRYEQSVEFEQ